MGAWKSIRAGGWPDVVAALADHVVWTDRMALMDLDYWAEVDNRPGLRSLALRWGWKSPDGAPSKKRVDLLITRYEREELDHEREQLRRQVQRLAQGGVSSLMVAGHQMQISEALETLARPLTKAQQEAWRLAVRQQETVGRHRGDARGTPRGREGDTRGTLHAKKVR